MKNSLIIQKEKLKEKIIKTEKIILNYREKIKNWNNEIKEIDNEQRKLFADEFIDIVYSNGLTEKEKNELLNEISKIVQIKAVEKKENLEKNKITENEINSNFEKNNSKLEIEKVDII